MGNGWIGHWGDLERGLALLKADRDEQGRYIVSGSIVSFMGGDDEYCVGEDARYYVDGKPQSLPHGLGVVGCGMNVTVI